jgi:hypothetical protein
LKALVVSWKNVGELLVALILLLEELLPLLLVRCSVWGAVRVVLSIGSTNSNFSCKWSLQNTYLYIYIMIKNVNNEVQFKLTADGASP